MIIIYVIIFLTISIVVMLSVTIPQPYSRW